MKLSTANQQATEKIIEDNLKFVPRLSIVYPTSQTMETKEDIGKFALGDKVIGDTLEIYPLKCRAVVTSHDPEDDGKTEATIMQNIATERDVFFVDPEMDKFKKRADEDGLIVKEAIDVLMYIKELDAFGVYLFRPTAMSEFNAINDISETKKFAKLTTVKQETKLIWFKLKVESDSTFSINAELKEKIEKYEEIYFESSKKKKKKNN